MHKSIGENNVVPRILRSKAVALSTAALLTFAMAAPAHSVNRDVDLVLLVVVDMLKGEVPFAYYDRLGDNGFKRLMDNGVSYTNAHYEHSTTFTAVGHGVIATGAPAAEHGLAGNDWADRITGERVYCVADPDSKPLVETRVRGTSPRNVTATTFADEIVLSAGGKSRTFGVSVKDRGAIIPAGRLGKAFWYEPTTGNFYTTTYYYDEMPEWLVAFNEAGHKDRYRGEQWTLLHDQETYVFGHQEERPEEFGYYELGNTFPKNYDNPRDADYYGGLRFSPAGDELTLDLARELMRAEEIGKRGVPDVLTISLSGQDYVGHAWGTHSLEYEDQFLQVDRMLGEFLDFVEEEIGLDRTLVVVTADHGSDDIPEYHLRMGLDAGRHYPERFMAEANEALRERFGIESTGEEPVDLVMAFWNPSLFLNPALIEQHGLDTAEVERVLAEAMLAQEGVRYAVTRSDILAGNVPDTPLLRKLLRAFHPERSGNVLFVQDQFWYLYYNPEQFAAMHGSPYAYDTHVPIIITGPGIEPQVVDRTVGVSDIAITVTNYMRARVPSGADGNLLVEALPKRGGLPDRRAAAN
jgi:predicted AlkP superfamily pyrophosphatase or phosphodiesterase